MSEFEFPNGATATYNTYSDQRGWPVYAERNGQTVTVSHVEEPAETDPVTGKVLDSIVRIKFANGVSTFAFGSELV